MSIRIPGHYIFQAHPRTGSTAIEAALNGDASLKHHDWIDGPEPSICVVRNPFDVMVSWFLLNPEWDDFTTFILDYNHSDLIKDGLLFYHAPKCEHILKWENLKVELNKFLISIGLKEIELPRINITPNKRFFSRYYDFRSIAAMLSRFGEEMDHYGY